MPVRREFNVRPSRVAFVQSRDVGRAARVALQYGQYRGAPIVSWVAKTDWATDSLATPVARTGAPVDALTVAWQRCMRQAAEDTAGFGEKPTPARGPGPAAAESVFLLAKLPVDPSSAFLAGSLHLADHVSANLPPDHPSPSAGPGQRGPGPEVPAAAPDPPRLPSPAQDPARNGHQPRL